MRPSRGYIAVVTAIILSAILTTLVFASSTSVFWERFDQLSTESKNENEIFAGSCAYEALMQYAEDANSVTGNEPIELQPDVYCVIDSVATSSLSQTFKVHANIHGSYVGLNISTTQSTSTGILSVTTWRDITSIPP
jgi:hypothetical protein